MSIDHSIPCPCCTTSVRADDHIRCGICGGSSRINIPSREQQSVRWLLMDSTLPHPLVVAALDHVMDCGQITAQEGISSMTFYRVGMVAGIRELARSMDMWHGLESALGEQCELLLEHWHYAAQDIAIDRDLRRPLVVLREAAA